MDSRHESLKQGFLNQVIMTINTYIVDNTDSLVTDESLKNELMEIGHQIYRYLGLNVDTPNILSRHNLLSKDVVVFPTIQDHDSSKPLDDTEFHHLIVAIKNILEKKASTDENALRKQILHVIDEYEM